MIKFNTNLSHSKKNKFYTVFILIFITILYTAVISTALAEREYMQPGYVFGTNYYNSYGEPEIYASLMGDSEFERGETAHLKINLVNKGVLYGFKYDTTVETKEGKHASSLKELEYETRRTTALGIKVEMFSPSPYIKVEPDTSIQYMEELFPGELPEDKLIYTITISNEAPAGVYYLQLPLLYEYQSQIRMSKYDVARYGLSGLDHITSYTTANRTLIIPIFVKAAPKFEVVDVAGCLVTGESHNITVTYRNSGETAVEDANARVVVMRPLSVKQSVVNMGTIGPGESKTALFDIYSDTDAVIKNYGIDSEIKYFDEDGETAFSDNLKINVPIQKATEKIGIFTIAVVGAFIVIIYLIINSIRTKNKFD
jgi:hypothetical protein